MPQVSVNDCKGTKIISNHQIKSQIFSNFFSSCKKWHIAKLYEPQSSHTNFLYIFKPSRAGQPPYSPIPAQRGAPCTFCTLMTTDAGAVMSSCHHAIMPLRKKACWEVKEIVYIILILYILFLWTHFPPFLPNPYRHDDMMT